MLDFDSLFCSVLVGVCVGSAVWMGRDGFSRGLQLIERDLSDRLKSLRIRPKRLRAWLHTWLGIVAAAFFVFLLAMDSFVFAILSGVMLAAIPWVLIRRLARERRQKIEDQLADAMGMFSSAIRAGLSLAQALEILAQESPHPIRQEFRQIVGEYQLGKPLERTLEEGKERLKSENFVLFAAALLASRESGGRLNETVERISKSVLELQRLERKVVSETAQARKSAVYMAIAPPILLGVYFFVDPVNTMLLFETLPGQMILAAAIVLNITAYFWALRILRADI